jgi:hypothetical protein
LEKLKPLVIGKFAKLRCFKNMSTSPRKYTHNKKAWVINKIFVDFLHQFDARMGSANRKVLLFLDKCPAHSLDAIILKIIKVTDFLPCKLHQQATAP